MMSAVTIDPRDKGTVESFSITSIGPGAALAAQLQGSPGRREPRREARRREFLKTKVEYQTANIKTINEVIKLEQDPKGEDDAGSAEGQSRVGQVARGHQLASEGRVGRTRRRARRDRSGRSLAHPARSAALDPKAFEGETVTKDVVVAAKMKTPDGKDVDKTLTITFARVSGTLAGTKREGRPVITKITGL